VKDNLNIEKLFKDKFENFEADVNPNIWANVAKGVSANTATSAGVGLGIKALIIGASAVAVGVTAYFVGGFNKNNSINTDKVVIENNDKIEELSPIVSNPIIKELVIIADINDPVITEHKNEILTELNKQNVSGLTDFESSINTIEEQNEVTTNQNETESNSLAENNSTQTEITDDVNSNTDDVEVDNNSEKEDQQVVIADPILIEAKIEYLTLDNPFKYSFNANPQDALKYEWNFGDGVTSTKQYIAHVYAKKGDYTVTLRVTYIDNQVFETETIVSVESISEIIKVPNVFTPNGDRINDVFVIQSENIETFTIVIQNQFGSKVFESNDVNFEWDGTDLNGDKVNIAVYSYYIQAVGIDGAIFNIPGIVSVR